jgi:hypothetical protein
MAGNRDRTFAYRALAAIVMPAMLLVACGSDDGGGDGTIESTIPADDTVPADDGATNGVDPDAAAPELPADYPLPIPEGGTTLSIIVDDSTQTSRVVVSYDQSSLDGLLATYDSFFDQLGGDTTTVPLTDGLASWLNEDAGYSVVINAQNPDVQVALQTGI